MPRSLPEWIGSGPDAAIPPRGVCSIPGCNRPVDSRGWCKAHWKRWRRNGDPLAGNTSPNACRQFIEETVLTWESDDCLKWPFGQNGKGYGTFHVNRRAVGAHVYICELVYGSRPSSLHEVAHSCGNGHLLCCNPHHLRWATRSENHADKIRHGTIARGTKNPRSVLNEAQVREIRSLAGKMSQKKIGAKFGVSQMLVCRIIRRDLWGWLS